MIAWFLLAFLFFIIAHDRLAAYAALWVVAEVSIGESA